jgi:hypothetical protein
MQPKLTKKGNAMTKTAQHTPGPWQDNDAGLIYGQVTGDDDEAPFICDCCNEPGSGEYTEQERANARLIKTAPDMLAALELCEEVLAELARVDDGTPSISALNAARAAIAKATG